MIASNNDYFFLIIFIISYSAINIVNAIPPNAQEAQNKCIEDICNAFRADITKYRTNDIIKHVLRNAMLILDSRDILSDRTPEHVKMYYGLILESIQPDDGFMLPLDFCIFLQFKEQGDFENCTNTLRNVYPEAFKNGNGEQPIDLNVDPTNDGNVEQPLDLNVDPTYELKKAIAKDMFLNKKCGLFDDYSIDGLNDVEKHYHKTIGMRVKYNPLLTISTFCRIENPGYKLRAKLKKDEENDEDGDTKKPIEKQKLKGKAFSVFPLSGNIRVSKNMVFE